MSKEEKNQQTSENQAAAQAETFSPKEETGAKECGGCGGGQAEKK